MNPGEEVAKERNNQYLDAWSKTGPLLHLIRNDLFKFLLMAPKFFFPWVIILNKLLRALGSPYNRDHWLDIAGYATLVLKDIDANPGKG